MKETLCIVGLGYVGLPLAHAFAEKGYRTIGFDINKKRIEELKQGIDRTDELTSDQLKEVSIEFSADEKDMKEATIFILAIPTPVDENNKPDLTLLEKASAMVGAHIKKGDIIVYESTVWPGTTEEICGPILEKASGLKSGTDFTLGYSPERINPGDKLHTVRTIIKIVSGQDETTLKKLSEVYGSIVQAGIFEAPSIKVAEMAKAIENAQRDLNIAFINEVALLCKALDIQTKDVLEAAGTKWNFLQFKPGIVGGHCIGVDPYYLVEKAKQLGIDTHVISAGRSINDSMSSHIADHIMEKVGASPKVLVLGLTFKENVPDTRNSKSFDVINELIKRGATVEAHDPTLTSEEITQKKIIPGSLDSIYDAVVLLVPHHEYLHKQDALIQATKEGGVIYDLKSILNAENIVQKGRMYVCL